MLGLEVGKEEAVLLRGVESGEELGLRRVAVFISDHGLGHASRCCAVISELCKRGANVLVVSKVPEWFFRESCGAAACCGGEGGPGRGRLEFYPFKTEVGTFQLSSVEIDPDKTLEALRHYWESVFPSEKEAVLQRLRSWRAGVIYFDVTAAAPLIAEELGVPCVAITNFSFDFIYSEYVPKHPEFERYVKLCADAYRRADALLKLPYPCDLSNWDSCRINQELGAWISRPVTRTKDSVRKTLLRAVEETSPNGSPPPALTSSPLEPTTLALPRKFLLLSFGGHDIPILERLESWRIPFDWTVVWVDQGEKQPKSFRTASGAIVVSQELLRRERINYVDLVAAMDVVLLKTGYGIVSEVVTSGVSVLYVDRPGFQEHIYLEKALKENVACRRVELSDVWKGTLWTQANTVVKEAKNSTRPIVPNNGAELAAEFLLSMCSGKLPRKPSSTLDNLHVQEPFLLR